jgi:hypothetical protein
MTSATLTLTDFLERRIAEDEAVARAATRSPWWYDPTKVNSVDREESVFTGERGLGAITVCSTGPCDDLGSMADAAHIARHDPARVLAECEAKRRIVETTRRRSTITSTPSVGPTLASGTPSATSPPSTATTRTTTPLGPERQNRPVPQREAEDGAVALPGGGPGACGASGP